MNNDSSQNSYVLDPNSPEEMARLIELDRMMTKAMGGTLAGLPDTSNIQKVIDLACGPGGWVLDMAFEHPEMEIAGVDISQIMIDYANARARSQRIYNASFGTMDITLPLDFADETFDLVNARLLIGVLRREMWRPFLDECMRILKPGGYLRLTEWVDAGQTSSPAHEKLKVYTAETLWRAGYGYRQNVAVSHVLAPLLRLNDCEQVTIQAHALEFSAHMEAWTGFYRNSEIAYALLQPVSVKMGVASQEEMEHLYQQTLAEMKADDFWGVLNFLTVFGRKPMA